MKHSDRKSIEIIENEIFSLSERKRRNDKLTIGLDKNLEGLKRDNVEIDSDIIEMIEAIALIKKEWK